MKRRKSATGFDDGRTLGSELRANRLGFRWLRPLGAYVRVSDEGGDCWRVDVAPADQVPGGRGTKKFPTLYRRWWETGRNDPGDIDGELAEHIRRVIAGDCRPVRIRQHLAFVCRVDDDSFVSWR